jgi:hypothetical protein
VKLSWEGEILMDVELEAAPLWSSSRPTEDGFVVAGAIYSEDSFGYPVHWLARGGEHLISLKREGVSEVSGDINPASFDILSDGRVVVAERDGAGFEVWDRGGEEPLWQAELPPLPSTSDNRIVAVMHDPKREELWVAVNSTPNGYEPGRPRTRNADLGSGNIDIFDLGSGSHRERIELKAPIVSLNQVGVAVVVVGGFGAGGVEALRVVPTSRPEREG